MIQGLCSMASTLCWIIATFMLGCGHPAVLQCPAVPPAVKDCPCQGTPRLVAPHRQPPAWAFVGVWTRQYLDGVNSSPNNHRNEQSTGVPVGWILNTMGPFDQQWYDTPSLWPCIMLRDTVNTFSHLSLQLPSLKMGDLHKTANHMILWLVPLKSLQKLALPLHWAIRDSTDWTPSVVKTKARGGWCSSTAGHLQSQPTHLVVATCINYEHSRVWIALKCIHYKLCRRTIWLSVSKKGSAPYQEEKEETVVILGAPRIALWKSFLSSGIFV